MTAMLSPADDPDLALLVEALAQIRSRASLQSGGSSRPKAPITAAATRPLPSDTVALAEALYRERRHRAQYFELGDQLFGEPAWDILLDLFIRSARGKRVSVSSACIGSAAPPTTALRWIGVLHDAELVERHPDPTDGRRIYLELAPEVRDTMEGYLLSLRSGGR